MGLLLQKESLSLQWWRTNKLGGAMAIYAISDLHLSLGTDKPMDIFGWGDHASKIKDYWNNKITNEDYILIPGDISWAINLEEASADFDFIDRLPGNKVLSKGNHDYWWCTRRKFEKYCSEKDLIALSFCTIILSNLKTIQFVGQEDGSPWMTIPLVMMMPGYITGN